MYIYNLCNFVMMLIGRVQDLFLSLILPFYVAGQSVESCPMIGCTPSGTFSYMLSYPTANVTYAWKTPFIHGPLSEPLGCVGNENNIICQTNSTFHKSYVSLSVDKGTPQWYEQHLRFPALPIMDVYGGIIGSDGARLVRYEANGKQDKPTISLGTDLSPIYSLSYSDIGIIVIVSKTGYLVTYEADGVPHASMTFPGYIDGVNGTFISVTSPVVSGARVYILTEFNPGNEEDTQKHLQVGLYRLYAVDIRQTINNRLDIAWSFDFDTGGVIGKSGVTTQIMYNTNRHLVYVNFPQSGNSNSVQMLWCIEDKSGSTPIIKFKVPLAVSNLAKFEGDSEWKTSYSEAKHGQKASRAQRRSFTSGGEKRQEMEYPEGGNMSTPLWGLSTTRELVLKISEEDGSVIGYINVTSLIRSPAIVTSDLMVARSQTDSEDNIIFGVKLLKSNTANLNGFSNLCCDSYLKLSETYYLVSVTEKSINWIIASPNDLEIKGQIAGIQGPTTSSRNLLVAVGSSVTKSTVFAVY